jgi:hypothetical protein
MITLETDGFRVFATWCHQGMVAPRHSCHPAQFANFDYISDPNALGPKADAPPKKSMTAAERKAARNRWQNR